MMSCHRNRALTKAKLLPESRVLVYRPNHNIHWRNMKDWNFRLENCLDTLSMTL